MKAVKRAEYTIRITMPEGEAFRLLEELREESRSWAKYTANLIAALDAAEPKKNDDDH